MTTYTFSTIISSSHMGCSIRKLEDVIRSNDVSKCSYKYGYFVYLTRIIKVCSVYIPRDQSGLLYITMTIEGEMIKPHIGDVYDAQINIVDEDGLMTDTPILNILVPASELLKAGYKYDKLMWYNESKDISLYKSDNFKVTILSHIYDAGQFKVCGSPL